MQLFLVSISNESYNKRVSTFLNDKFPKIRLIDEDFHFLKNKKIWANPENSEPMCEIASDLHTKFTNVTLAEWALFNIP